MSKYNPLVSIALTTYNGGQLIVEQIDSLLDQSYSNFEIVISDDGSDEGTVTILEEYARSDPRIKWFKSPLERGYMNNTQNAISLCKGEIIFLCDQDDTWHKEKVALHVEAYKDLSVFWVYNRLVLTDKDNKKELGYLEDFLPDYYSPKRMKLLYLTWGSCIGGAMTSYRASILHKSMPIGKYAHGHDSWIQLAIFPKKGFFIDTVLQTYRQHGKNEVGWGKKMTAEELIANEKKAISRNMLFLRSLPANKNLTLWKRSLFLFVYYAKKMRAYFLNNLGTK